MSTISKLIILTVDTPKELATGLSFLCNIITDLGYIKVNKINITMQARIAMNEGEFLQNVFNELMFQFCFECNDVAYLKARVEDGQTGIELRYEKDSFNSSLASFEEGIKSDHIPSEEKYLIGVDKEKDITPHKFPFSEEYPF